MTKTIKINNIEIEITKKKIKSLRIKVYPNQKVKVSAPNRLKYDDIISFIESKMSWIEIHLKTFENRPKKAEIKMIKGENHYFLGKKYELEIVYVKNKHKIIKNESKLELHIRENTKTKNRLLVLENCYKSELEKIIPELILKWENIINVKVNEFTIRKTKRIWGSCNINKKKITLSLELAKKDIDLIEYVLVHELVHLLERYHNKNFFRLMDKYLPKWREKKNILNNIT